MDFLMFSVAVSSGLVFVIYLLARTENGIGKVCCLTAVATLFFLLISPALFFQSLGSFLIALGCFAYKRGPRTVVLGSLAAMVVTYGTLLWLSRERLHEFQQLRERYPLESVAERLRYERKVWPDMPPPDLQPAVRKRLSELENQLTTRFGYRSDALSALHNRAADAFVIAQGFGPMRMRPVPLSLPESQPVPLPVLPEDHAPSASSEQPDAPLAAARDVGQGRPSLVALQSMHAEGAFDFLDLDRMGFIQDRDHVAGFEPHAFSTIPKFDQQQPLEQQWQLVRLELVSLLKHDTPVAYVSQQLPRLEKLKDFPTRPLNAFERRAIERLRTDEDVVIEESVNRIRMVGSLRAATKCLECHSASHGELLGALSYELVPLHPAPVPKSEDKPLPPST